MLWECGECGARLERERPTTVCRSCGTAGAVFVPAEPGLAGAEEGSSLHELWFDRGFRQRPRARPPRRARARSRRDMLDGAI